MIHGPRLVTQRDLYWEAVARHERRARREREESLRILRAILLAAGFGVLIFVLLLVL